MTDEQLELLRQVARFDAIFRDPDFRPNVSYGEFASLAPEVDEFFELIYRGSNLEVSGAADYHEWLASDRGQRLLSHDPAALDDASFSDVMFAWVVLHRAGHWAWEEEYVESFETGVFLALTGRAIDLLR